MTLPSNVTVVPVAAEMVGIEDGTSCYADVDLPAVRGWQRQMTPAEIHAEIISRVGRIDYYSKLYTTATGAENWTSVRIGGVTYEAVSVRDRMDCRGVHHREVTLRRVAEGR